MTPQEKLQLAAELIEQVEQAMPIHTQNCSCCERVTVLNWPTKMARDVLHPIPAKLRRVAGSDSAFAPVAVPGPYKVKATGELV